MSLTKDGSIVNTQNKWIKNNYPLFVTKDKKKKEDESKLLTKMALWVEKQYRIREATQKFNSTFPKIRVINEFYKIKWIKFKKISVLSLF